MGDTYTQLPSRCRGSEHQAFTNNGCGRMKEPQHIGKLNRQKDEGALELYREEERESALVLSHSLSLSCTRLCVASTRFFPSR